VARRSSLEEKGLDKRNTFIYSLAQIEKHGCQFSWISIDGPLRAGGTQGQTEPTGAAKGSGRQRGSRDKERAT